MEYARSTRTPAPPSAKRKLRTGPLPSVPWSQLDRKTSIEQHLPLLILLAFALLATIQVLLSR